MTSAGFVRTTTAGMIGFPSSACTESGGVDTAFAASSVTAFGGDDDCIALQGPITSLAVYHVSRPFRYQTLVPLSCTMKYGVLTTVCRPVPSTAFNFGSPSTMMSTVGLVA